MRDSKKGGKKSITKSKRQRAQKSTSKRMGRKTSKRDKLESALKTAENLYRAIMDNNHLGFTVMDRNYRIVLANDVMSRFLRKPASELIGQECFREYEKRDSICPHCPGRKTMATGQPAEVETEGVRDDGVRVSVRNQTFPVFDSDGAIAGFIEISEDISERKKAEKVLRQQHNLLRLLIDNLPDSVYVKDSESRFILANQAVIKYEGVKTEKELLGKTDFDLYSKEWATRFYAEEQEVIQKHRPLINQERFYINKYGKEQWVLTTKVPLKDDKGKIIGLVGINRDITERKRAEQALRDSEELYHAIFDQAADSVMLIDTETGRMVEFNDKAHENLGYTREEFKKLRLADIEVIEPEEKVVKHIRTIIKKGSDIFETKHRTKNGEERNIQVSARAISLRGKDFIQGIWRDITERKKAEEELEKSEERFRQVAENAQEWIWEVDAKGLYTYASPILEKILGYKPQEIVGKKNFYDFFDPRDREEMKKWAFEVFAQKQPFHKFINRNIHKNGRIVWLSTSGVPIRDKKGKLLGYRGADTDITEHKKAEQKLRDDRQQLRSLASELTLAEERERSRIVAELHDETIQTVSIAKMELEELRTSVHDKELDKKIEQIGNSLGKTIKDIRSLMFKVSSPIFEQFGFEEAVQDWLTEEIEKKHGIKTEFKNDGQNKPLDDDVSALLFRNVRELLTNVVKHARATKVKVSINKVDSRIKTCVEDNGIGFDPGKVVDKAVSKGGFGLFSIRQRLEQFEGSLEIESEPGGGCCIIMTVPLKQE
jgi:PAS domain S-box-containing protein